LIAPYETDNLEQGYYTQAGTVLQRRDSSKEGQSLLLFLRDMGPRWVYAPAASAKSRFGGMTEPLVWGTFNLYQSPGRLYFQGAEIREDFLSLRSSPKLLMTALRFYKRTAKVLLVGHESNSALNILWSSLLLLKENCPSEIVELRFTWKLLKTVGLAPSLVNCVNCGSVLNESSFWSSDGLLCSNCCSGTGKMKVSYAVLRMLQAAVLLDHNKFIKWSNTQQSMKMDIYNDQLKMLMTFFADFN
jgi:DNA repair protein RecO (recombination protein O)